MRLVGFGEGKVFMSEVLKQGPHEETEFCESDAMETQRSLFQKTSRLFADIFTVLTCFRFSIAAMITLTRG
jgi:hypothetical protein